MVKIIIEVIQEDDDKSRSISIINKTIPCSLCKKSKQAHEYEMKRNNTLFKLCRQCRFIARRKQMERKQKLDRIMQSIEPTIIEEPEIITSLPTAVTQITDKNFILKFL